MLPVGLHPGKRPSAIWSLHSYTISVSSSWIRFCFWVTLRVFVFDWLVENNLISCDLVSDKGIKFLGAVSVLCPLAICVNRSDRQKERFSTRCRIHFTTHWATTSSGRSMSTTSIIQVSLVVLVRHSSSHAANSLQKGWNFLLFFFQLPSWTVFSQMHSTQSYSSRAWRSWSSGRK